MELYHNSHDDQFRLPFGAVEAGTAVQLRLYASGAPRSVQLRVWNGSEQLIDMKPVGLGLYEAVLKAPDQPMLVWYDFRAEDERGRYLYYGNARDRLGGIGTMYQDRPPSYQITVYDSAFMPPAFLRQGVMYQIFPDRFARSKMPQSDRTDVYLHREWDSLPMLDPDSRSGDNRAFDFFGGNLNGIREKLPYLESLGVTVLYLNPIFKARSNHRYDTGDYSLVDPLLGTNEEFAALCDEAKQHGMRVLLDGVFSHTGEDSVYFNRYGSYDSVGAWQSKDSRYYPWYTFTEYPNRYAAWWGVPTLPEVNKDNPDFRAFIAGPDGIARRWIREGASGWRLDVADELPVSFLRDLRCAVKAENPDSVLLGEVWEDASNKVAYGEMRSYCLGDTVDSVMNYPLRDAVIRFLTGAADAAHTVRVIRSLQENYPVPFFYSLMNLMGSHDRARILNVLCRREYVDLPRQERGKQKLPPQLRALAVARYRNMLAIYMALPGIPSIYYGDEAGLEGAADPYCRGTYPWDREDPAVFDAVRDAIALRKARPVLRTGTLELSSEGPDTLVIHRGLREGRDVFGQPLDDRSYCLRVTRDPVRV